MNTLWKVNTYIMKCKFLLITISILPINNLWVYNMLSWSSHFSCCHDLVISHIALSDELWSLYNIFQSWHWHILCWCCVLVLTDCAWMYYLGLVRWCSHWWTGSEMYIYIIICKNNLVLVLIWTRSDSLRSYTVCTCFDCTWMYSFGLGR